MPDPRARRAEGKLAVIAFDGSVGVFDLFDFLLCVGGERHLQFGIGIEAQQRKDTRSWQRNIRRIQKHSELATQHPPNSKTRLRFSVRWAIALQNKVEQQQPRNLVQLVNFTQFQYQNNQL